MAALRPGDVVLELDNASLLSVQTSGSGSNFGSAHVQSANINVSMSRSDIYRLGTSTPMTKSLDTPVSVTLSISAILADLKKGNLITALCNCERHDLTIKIYDPNDPSCGSCNPETGAIAMEYRFTRALLTSGNFTSTIGDNKIVDLEFSTQIDFFEKGG